MQDEESLRDALPNKNRILRTKFVKTAAKAKVKVKFGFRKIRRKSGQVIRQVTSPTPKTPFRFADLPTELRHRIYEYALVDTKPLEIKYSDLYSEKVDPKEKRNPNTRQIYSKSLAIGLLRTCRAINQEAAPIFFGMNDFAFRHRYCWTHFERWVTEIRENIFHVTAVSLNWPAEAWKFPRNNNNNVAGLASLMPVMPRRSSFGLARGRKHALLDGEAFQRICRELARKGKLNAIYLWAKRPECRRGFNPILVETAFIVPCKKVPVKLSNLKLVRANDVGGSVVAGEGADDIVCWAIQVQKNWHHLHGSSIRHSSEVVNYFIPGAVSKVIE